eukprot:scaffold520_cov224-Pinguiococcus_pyrenoidosus.AAC.9
MKSCASPWKRCGACPVLQEGLELSKVLRSFAVYHICQLGGSAAPDAPAVRRRRQHGRHGGQAGASAPRRSRRRGGHAAVREPRQSGGHSSGNAARPGDGRGCGGLLGFGPRNAAPDHRSFRCEHLGLFLYLAWRWTLILFLAIPPLMWNARTSWRGTRRSRWFLREASRHYLGRVFATLASMILDLRIYDTQCGAKLFRASPELKAVLATSFHSRWIFDVELIARFAVGRRLARDAAHAKGHALPPAVDESVFEYPLDEWTDIKGSKLKFRDQVGALYGLAYIWWSYFSWFAAWPTSVVGLLDEQQLPYLKLRQNLMSSAGPEGDRARERFGFYLNVIGAMGLTLAVGVLGLLWLL